MPPARGSGRGALGRLAIAAVTTPPPPQSTVRVKSHRGVRTFLAMRPNGQAMCLNPSRNRAEFYRLADLEPAQPKRRTA